VTLQQKVIITPTETRYNRFGLQWGLFPENAKREINNQLHKNKTLAIQRKFSPVRSVMGKGDAQRHHGMM
jgi:hypothetical protein